MAAITFSNASRQYAGAVRPAVDGLDLRVEDGEFLVLVGPSGCGKSTSLRMLAGLEEVDHGSIHVGNRDVTLLPSKDRDIAMVFQNFALFPHMTVAHNMGFALKIAGVRNREINSRVRAAARVLDLEAYLQRKPKALSGGQQQRVALGRAMVREPQAFLMDEPLCDLDATLRCATRRQIRALQRRLGVTTVYVTQDHVEAMTMGDRIAVMKDGVLQQCDTPRTVLERPANSFVAGFIGSPPMNLCQIRLDRGGVSLAGMRITVPRSVVAAAGAPELTLGFRPDSLRLVGAAEDGFDARVEEVEELGSEAFARFTLRGHGRDRGDVEVVAKVDPQTRPSLGDRLRLSVRPGALHFFSVQTGDRLSQAEPCTAAPVSRSGSYLLNSAGV